jgi:DNA-binding response OmpR family regulator
VSTEKGLAESLSGKDDNPDTPGEDPSMDREEKEASTPVIVKCSWCGKVYRVHLDRLPHGVSTFPCRGCGSSLSIPGPAEAGKEESRIREGASRVLVAVSEEDLAELIRKILRRAGFQVLVGYSGEEVLDVLEKEPVDILLVSVSLPDLMGFEVLDRLRQMEGKKTVPSILLSSVYHGARYKRAPASLYGANDYIERHHLPDMLLPKIERLLSPPEEASPPQATPAPGPLSDEQVLQKRELEVIEGSPPSAEDSREVRLRRLCRVIAGDIVLYNEDVIRSTDLSGVLEKLREDLREGEVLLEGKFGEAGKQASDWLREEVDLLVRMRNVQKP